MANRKEVLANLTAKQKQFMDVIAQQGIDDIVKDVLKANEEVEQIEITAILVKEVLMTKVYATGDRSYKGQYGSVSVQTRKSPDRVDRAMLIVKGVDPDVVDACTVPGGESDPFVVVRAAKVKVS